MMEQFGGFLDNIGQMLEDEPLDNEGLKRSKKLALRSKLRTFKKKTDQLKSLNIKKITSDTKRKKLKFQSQIQSKTASQLQISRKMSFIPVDKNDNCKQVPPKHSSSIFMTKPSDLALDCHFGNQNVPSSYNQSCDFLSDQFEMKFGDRTNTYHNAVGKIPQSDARQLNMFSGQENMNIANQVVQDSSKKFNSLFSKNINEMQRSMNQSQAPLQENNENFYL